MLHEEDGEHLFGIEDGGTDMDTERYRQCGVLVVGGSRGIGAAVAERLAAEGARVGVADLDEDAASRVASRLPGRGHVGLRMDVLDPASIEVALDAYAATGAELDALVHVAGGDTAHSGFEDASDDVWRSMLDLNLLGPVRVIRAALPLLRASRRPAAVAVVSSVNARLTLGSEPYSAAKAGLGPVIANLAAELGPEGVRVNAVAPGTVRTSIWDHQGGPDRLAGDYPLRRVGEPEDVAAAIAFLCSHDAAWITGHTLPVDGGLSIARTPLG